MKKSTTITNRNALKTSLTKDYNTKVSFKALSVAAVAGLFFIGGGVAQATTIDDIDMSQKPIDTPTLDYLHDNDVKMTNEYGVETGVYPQSSYTLTKVEANADGTKPEGDNIVTKFEYDQNADKLIPVYYALELKKTEYGHKDATNQEIENYYWTLDRTDDTHDITYYVDKDRLATNYDYGDQKGADINKDFVNKGIYLNKDGTIGNITGDFFNGNSYNTRAMTNGGIIGNISGDFIGNYSNYYGAAAIDNEGTIGNITGDFIGNISSSYISLTGGAIYNRGTIGDITGNFIGNSSMVDARYQPTSAGGALYNRGTIGNITGDFIGNFSSASKDSSSGGAIYNSGNIGDITCDFIGNSSNASKDSSGGAINNHGFIKDISGDFVGNSSDASDGYSSGGAIDNWGVIGAISGNFTGNTSNSSDNLSVGGAIRNIGTIKDISGNFVGNSSNASDGYSSGGAIYNNGNDTSAVNTIPIYYSKLTVTNSDTGESYTFNEIFGDDNLFNFDYNSSLQDNIDKANSKGYKIIFVYIGEDHKTGKSDKYEELKKSYEEMLPLGWAVDENADPQTTVSINNPASLTITNSSFIGNYAKSVNGDAKGGAIYSNNNLDIVADGATSVFKGNYTESNGEKDDNAIYIDNGATLNLIMKNGGKIYMADNIDGEGYEDPSLLNSEQKEDYLTNTYNVNIKGDDINNTTFYMLNDIRNANVTFDNTTINTVNNQVHVYDFNTLTVKSDTNFVADVDLANEQMDRITAKDYGSHQGNLNVTGMNLLSDSTKDVTEIYFAERGLKDNVVNNMPKSGGYNLPSNVQTTFYTPIYKYNAIYDNRDDGGYFMFAKGDKILSSGENGGITVTPSGNPSDAFNPAVLAPSVALQAGANATVNETFKYVFEHADTFTQLPSMDRLSHIKANQYALSTDYNENLGNIATEFNNKAGWVRPYVTFEKMNLKNAPAVNATTYGTLIGFDSDFQKYKHGWTGLTTGYIGYNGSQLRYNGGDTTMNGGLLGLTQTFYKGNLWTALTVSAGATVGQTTTMYGKEDFTTLLAGVGSKTGYNFEFKEGKYIIQPIWFMSYTFANTFDYTNAAGVRINSDPMHSIMLNPSVRFITNTKNGWQPYASIGMVWNAMNESSVKANNVKLPESSIKPYVEYGVGLQKRFKDKYTAFGQAMIRNGGRNGIAMTFGFRWNLGKEGKPIEKVQNVNVNKKAQVNNNTGLTNNNTPERKIIKQLSLKQKIALGLTSRTDVVGVLKEVK